MSEESSAPSEAPSLGAAIQKLSKSKSPAMKAIIEDQDRDRTDEEMDCSGIDDEINDMLDEALDDSQDTMESSGPTPPKVARSSPSSSAGSWEFQVFFFLFFTIQCAILQFLHPQIFKQIRFFCQTSM